MCSHARRAAPDGRALRKILSDETSSMDVSADTAYRAQSNETWLTRTVFTGRIHRRKPRGKTMPDRSRRPSVKKPAVRTRARARAHVEHVFAHQKNRYGLVIGTMGIARAEAKLTLANLAGNCDRLMFNERNYAVA